MLIKENPLFRRLRKHAQKRLVFDPGVSRSKQLPAYKRFVQLENKMLKRYHRNGDAGVTVCQARAAMVDVVIENLLLAALDLYTSEHGVIPYKMAVLATGGYGRRELNPHSDIDIMFLYPEKMQGKNITKFQEIISEEVLYPLWDLGFKVGHASRNKKEVIEEAKKEIQSKNSILESRMICGSDSLYIEMYERFTEYYTKENPTDYIQQRLTAELERHAKAGNTIYLQEPDIKNGVGGLRDYQNILWTAHIKSGYSSFREIEKAKLLRRDERIQIEKAYDFLLRTRTELHLQNRRPTDKLDLEQQPVIAEFLKYPQEDIFVRVEAFMKDYYTAARTIFHTSEMLKERLSLSAKETTPISFKEAIFAHRKTPTKIVDGFMLSAKVFSTESTNVFKKDPVRLIRIFRHLQQFRATLDPDLKYLISRSIPLIDSNVINSQSAAKSFCSILRSPGEVFPTLNLMHEIGVLGRYLPEFGKLTCLVQHEYYHRYTADAHVLNTIRHLDQVFLQTEEFDITYEKELRKNDDPLLLYLILLLHDIGKSEGVKGHAFNGLKIAKPVLKRFEIGDEQQAQILFIIRNHLEMARFWQRFDLDDPQTAVSFADLVEDTEKLRFLYVHTYCDARGTAPTLWNGYKDAMHGILYSRTLELLASADVIEKKRAENKKMLHKQILEGSISGVTKEEIDAHFSLLPERYFINTETEEIELHLRLVHDLLHTIQFAESVGALAPIIDWKDDLELGMTVVTVVTWDRAGLFYRLAGALTLAGADIISTKAISRSDHISIDTFYVIDPGGGVVSNGKSKNVFHETLTDALINHKELLPAITDLENRDKSPAVPSDLLPAPFPPSVDVYHELSLKRTIIEVQTNDRLGLLYRLARLIYKKGFDISFARVATERGVAMDTFYIEKINSKESTNTSNLLELREELDTIIRENI